MAVACRRPKNPHAAENNGSGKARKTPLRKKATETANVAQGTIPILAEGALIAGRSLSSGEGHCLHHRTNEEAGILDPMILINVRFRPLPEYVENFREIVADFTTASRNEPGNLWFDWFRSVDDPTEYVLVEGFEDGSDGAHVNSAHFMAACELFPTILRETPEIINISIQGKTGWDRMAEFSVEK